MPQIPEEQNEGGIGDSARWKGKYRESRMGPGNLPATAMDMELGSQNEVLEEPGLGESEIPNLGMGIPETSPGIEMQDLTVTKARET